MVDKLNTWDLIHATMEVATYAKVQKTQQQLEELKSASERESARQGFIEEQKSFIFDISRNIRLLEEEIEKFPQKVYIMAKSIEQRLLNSGFSDEMFPDFNDKEYVFKTQKKITEVIEKSKACLSQSEIQQSIIAIQYITELPILQQSIVSSSSEESLKKTNYKFHILDEQHRHKSFLKKLGITGLVFSGIFFLPLLLYGLVAIFTEYYFCGGTMILIGGFFLIGSIVIFVRNEKVDPNYTSLKISRENLEKQLLNKKDWQQIVNTYGDLNSEQFQKIYNERIDFLNQTFKSKLFSEFHYVTNETKTMHHSQSVIREDNEKEDNTFTFPCDNGIQADDNQQDEFAIPQSYQVKFKCKGCGKDIYIRYLKPGELSKCKYCNTENIVPDYDSCSKKEKIECPYCSEMINKFTTVCPFCEKEIK